MELVYKNEKSLFLIGSVISALIWISLIVGTFGLILLFLLLGYVVFLFAHSGFITYLKGSGVRISSEQYPDLHDRLTRCCEKVGLEQVPEAYLLRTDFFNALATRFLRRHFVVLFTDVVDALEEKPDALDFYIGHELGHIHRNHILKNSYLFPAMLLPLLGAAYRRAEEYTCDRYGTACCEDEQATYAALAAIAAGDTRWKTINIPAYIEQTKETSGFWMSFNELTSDYPWLTKRMATCNSLIKGEEIHHPKRSFFAWFLAIFIPRFPGAGASSALVMVAVLGVLAAVALPAYQNYSNRAAFSELVLSVTSRKTAIEAAINSGSVASLDQLDGGSLGIPADVEPTQTTNGATVEDGVVTMTWALDNSALAGITYILYLDYSGDSLQWFEEGTCLANGFC